MKIAIASSGLGHVARGIETWALDTANALHARGVDVTLFAAGEVESEAPLVALRCIRRRTPLSDFIVKLMPPFTWRWGLKAGYGLEQLTFWRRLRDKLNEGKFDILHIQDPMVADLCRKGRAAGRVHAREILAHGTEESLEFLSHFDYLQHLAPWHLQESLKELADLRPLTSGLASPPAAPRPFWTAMPNFVDTELYCPVADDNERKLIRRNLRIPEDAFVVGTAAAIKKHHKRIDYLIREFAHYCSAVNDSAQTPYLVVAGSKQGDTEELQALASELCPDRVKFLVDHPHKRMPDVLRCYNAFALTSLFEMMPIALLEAIATGLPVITNNHPVLEWMGGPGGIRPDMRREGALAKTLQELTPDSVATHGQAARDHALQNFSVGAVMDQYLNYYEKVRSSPA